MPRQKRESHKTPLAQFLRRVLKEQHLSILQASRIAGCAPSVLHGWLLGWFVGLACLSFLAFKEPFF